MSGHEVPALTPKVPSACCVCDCARCDESGACAPGGRVLVLMMLDGSLSEHTLCGGCAVGTDDLERIWDRACLLYAKVCKPEYVKSGHLERYVKNIPLGIVEIREDDR